MTHSENRIISEFILNELDLYTHICTGDVQGPPESRPSSYNFSQTQIGRRTG